MRCRGPPAAVGAPDGGGAPAAGGATGEGASNDDLESARWSCKKQGRNKGTLKWPNSHILTLRRCTFEAPSFCAHKGSMVTPCPTATDGCGRAEMRAQGGADPGRVPPLGAGAATTRPARTSPTVAPSRRGGVGNGGRVRCGPTAGSSYDSGAAGARGPLACRTTHSAEGAAPSTVSPPGLPRPTRIFRDRTAARGGRGRSWHATQATLRQRGAAREGGEGTLAAGNATGAGAGRTGPPTERQQAAATLGRAHGHWRTNRH